MYTSFEKKKGSVSFAGERIFNNTLTFLESLESRPL